MHESRFSDYGVLAPKSKVDYAFLLHGFYHLKNTGTMAIILSHGVLFRSAAEGKIRQKLIDNEASYAVIGLPANLFYNTSIPTTIIALKKNRPPVGPAGDGRDILFIDASQQFVKGKKQNSMSTENIDHIIELYRSRTDAEKEAHLASYEEIKANGYNLNIPRYVDTFEPEEQISLSDLASEFSDISAEMDTAATDLITQMGELTAADDETKNELTELIKVLEGML